MESFIGGKRVGKIFGHFIGPYSVFAKFFWVKFNAAYFLWMIFFGPANLSFGQTLCGKIFPFLLNSWDTTSKHFWQTRWALYTNGVMMLFWCSWILSDSGNRSLN